MKDQAYKSNDSEPVKFYYHSNATAYNLDGEQLEYELGIRYHLVDIDEVPGNAECSRCHFPIHDGQCSYRSNKWNSDTQSFDRVKVTLGEEEE